jgi:excinuclease ABC subunit A
MKNIFIKGARVHNLKNIDVTIPRDKMVVITGLSGSGKSSLAFDTIYAEGQRRYVESLSAYARQFLGQMDKPDVDHIDGLSPAISIDQKTTSKNPRSTVGTVTEIHDYLRLLYARAGTPHCVKCGKPIERQGVDQMIAETLKLAEGTKLLILAPVVRGRKGEYRKLLDKLQKAGFVRAIIDGITYGLDEQIPLEKNKKHTIDVIVDRVVIKKGIKSRLASSFETALHEAHGLLKIKTLEDDFEQLFSRDFSCADCGISMEEISPRMFSFNNPYGACPTCHGLGFELKVDADLVVPNKKLSLRQSAINVPGWNSEPGHTWGGQYFLALAKHYDFSMDTPFKDLPEKIQNIVLYGTNGERIAVDYKSERGQGVFQTKFEGIVSNMERRYRETGSDNAKVMYESYMTMSACKHCKGKRLKDESLAVLIGEKNIIEVSELSITHCMTFFEKLVLSDQKMIIATRIIKEIKERLNFLLNVGLSYLSLSRSSGTLSGGEAQRIRLATQIGSGLTGVLYILDEPSIGLHQRDNKKLIDTLKELKTLGNTLIVVEHDEETILSSDYVLDIGPGAGSHGGEVVSCGTPKQIMADKNSITGRYLSGIEKIDIPEKTRQPKGELVIMGAQQNNLKNIDAPLKLGVVNAVTGVSGSGKSSLINEILYKSLAKSINRASKVKPGKHRSIDGAESFDKIVDIDQSPIGRTPRSNPCTYTKMFTHIRDIFAATEDAKIAGYNKGRFSFNVKGGRCEACSGDGIIKIEMHFLPDVYVPCEVCKSKRYNNETLEIKYKGKNIFDVLDMTVEAAYKFFENIPRIHKILQVLMDVGLSYVKLGQPSTTLSGGEAQRIKLATHLSKRQTGNTMYILDEPTTGLHMADVKRLIGIIDRLADKGNTIVIIEHNLDIIKCADYVLDLGPEGGDAGGEIVAIGTPREIAQDEKSYTGQYLKRLFSKVD